MGHDNGNAIQVAFHKHSKLGLHALQQNLCDNVW